MEEMNKKKKERKDGVDEGSKGRKKEWIIEDRKEWGSKDVACLYDNLSLFVL